MIGLNNSIVTRGLVASHDREDIKSYAGPPITNLLTTITPNGSDNGSTYRFFSGTQDVYIPEIGNVTVPYVDMYNDYNGGSGSCCPNPYSFGSFSVSGSTEYTYAILYKSANRYTHPNYMYHYEYGPSGYITEYGLFYTDGTYSGSERHLGDGWYWASSKFTTNASTTSLTCYAFMYQYATWNRLSVAKVLLTPGNYLNLHPKYWPNVGTSKSTSNMCYNTAQTNIAMSPSSLVYSNDGKFYFNGSSSYLSFGASNNFLPMPQFTLETWHKSSGLGSGMSTSSLWGITYGITGNIYSDGSANFSTYNSDTSSTYSSVGTSGVNLLNNVWRHVVYVVDTNTSYLYVDGVLNASASNSGTWSGTNVWNTMAALVGNNPNNVYYYFNGQISVARIYNKALTAAEVKQNFTALRGRYGV